MLPFEIAPIKYFLFIPFLLMFCPVPAFGKNKLAQEKSPYLLQHAANPVAWYPWGEEAFTKAREENKPIFLSIGYSTCHWCHVMEEESFEDEATANILNKFFVSIKVDREERPDVDNTYMSAVMRMTGGGGWPLNVFLTPDLKPFFGGTYFPKTARWGAPAFSDILNQIADKWASQREELITQSQYLTRHLKPPKAPESDLSQALGEATLTQAFEELRARFDGPRGGFGDAPKFPRSHTLSFLLSYHKRSGEAEARAMVETTLQKMAAGGIHDLLGGGFHRYSTDGEWFVPHFEKMLYDQALLSKTYLEAYQITRNEFYANVARDIFDYVLRDMTSPEGGFYSAEDADSAPDAAKPQHKTEGAFYVWDEAELAALLSENEARIAKAYFGTASNGNVSHDPHGELKGKNILKEAQSVETLAKQFELSPEEVVNALESAKKKMFAAREKKPRPSLDDKVLTDWNGLMISSLAFGAKVLNEPRYEEAAKQAADFILERLRTKEGRLLHRYREGEAGILGFIEDYAFFSHGLIDLYQATYEPRYLEEAKNLLTAMRELFWDEAAGGFFFSGKDGEAMIAPTKELYDGAIPSGNSVAAYSLLRMGRIAHKSPLEGWGSDTLEAFSHQIERSPSAYPQTLLALDFAIGPTREIVIAAKPGDAQAKAMIQTVFNRYLPKKVVLWSPSKGDDKNRMQTLVSFLKNQQPMNGMATAYVCKNYVCQFPTTDLEKLSELLDSA